MNYNPINKTYESIDTAIENHSDSEGKGFNDSLSLGYFIRDAFFSHLGGAVMTGLLNQITDPETAGYGYYAGAFATFGLLQYINIKKNTLKGAVESFQRTYDRIGGLAASVLVPHLVGGLAVSTFFDPGESGGAVSFTYAGSFIGTYLGMTISEASEKSLKEAVGDIFTKV
jgi:hypothetical protein